MTTTHRKGFLCILFAFVFISAYPTHLRCGEILIQRVSGNTVDITVRVFTNSTSPVPFGGDQDVLHFGDGQSVLVPEQQNIIWEGPYEEVGTVSYTVRHTYTSSGKYTVSYTEPNRNDQILNFDNSVTTEFYVETSFVLDPFIEVYNTPVAFFDPIFYAYKDQPFSASLAAGDPDDTELHYTIVTPLQGRNRQVQNYKLPENFTVDEFSGLITWDNKFMGSYRTGEYLFAVQIDQYAVVGGERVRVGSAYRDFQVILIDTDVPTGGRISDNVEDVNLNVFENSSKRFRIFTAYAEGETVEIEVASSLPDGNLIVETYDSTSASGPMKVTAIFVETDAAIIRNHPYIISVRSNILASGYIYIADANYNIFTKEYDPITGIEDNPKKKFFTPNPAKEFIDLHPMTENAVSLEFVSMNGNQSVRIYRGSERRIDLTTLAPGVYVIRLKDRSGKLIAVDKLLKQ